MPSDAALKEKEKAGLSFTSVPEEVPSELSWDRL